MKPSGPRLLFLGNFLITTSTLLLDLNLLRFSVFLLGATIFEGISSHYTGEAVCKHAAGMSLSDGLVRSRLGTG